MAQTKGSGVKIPDGWEYCTTESDEDAAWRLAIALKERREALRHDLFVRVKVVPGYGRGRGSWWILRRDEQRQESAR